MQDWRDVAGSLPYSRILLPCSTREMWWEAGRTWCHGAHMCHAFGWTSRWLSSDMTEIAFPSKFGTRGGRLFIVASASCQLLWQNRWPCLWSCVLKAPSSDAENRWEQPPDLTYSFVYVHNLFFASSSKLARAYLFIHCCLQRGLFDHISLFYQPLVMVLAAQTSTNVHGLSCHPTLQNHSFLFANHVAPHELTELELRAQNDRAWITSNLENSHCHKSFSSPEKSMVLYTVSPKDDLLTQLCSKPWWRRAVYQRWVEKG